MYSASFLAVASLAALASASPAPTPSANPVTGIGFGDSTDCSPSDTAVVRINIGGSGCQQFPIKINSFTIDQAAAEYQLQLYSDADCTVPEGSELHLDAGGDDVCYPSYDAVDATEFKAYCIPQNGACP